MLIKKALLLPTVKAPPHPKAVHDICLGDLRQYTNFGYFGRCCRPLFVVESQEYQELPIDMQHIVHFIKGQQADQEVYKQQMSWIDLSEVGLVE